jgi:hypothetical protein
MRNEKIHECPDGVSRYPGNMVISGGEIAFGGYRWYIYTEKEVISGIEHCPYCGKYLYE